MASVRDEHSRWVQQNVALNDQLQELSDRIDRIPRKHGSRNKRRLETWRDGGSHVLFDVHVTFVNLFFAKPNGGRQREVHVICRECQANPIRKSDFERHARRHRTGRAAAAALPGADDEGELPGDVDGEQPQPGNAVPSAGGARVRLEMKFAATRPDGVDSDGDEAAAADAENGSGSDFDDGFGHDDALLRRRGAAAAGASHRRPRTHPPIVGVVHTEPVLEVKDFFYAQAVGAAAPVSAAAAASYRDDAAMHDGQQQPCAARRIAALASLSELADQKRNEQLYAKAGRAWRDMHEHDAQHFRPPVCYHGVHPEDGSLLDLPPDQRCSVHRLNIELAVVHHIPLPFFMTYQRYMCRTHQNPSGADAAARKRFYTFDWFAPWLQPLLRSKGAEWRITKSLRVWQFGSSAESGAKATFMSEEFVMSVMQHFRATFNFDRTRDHIRNAYRANYKRRIQEIEERNACGFDVLRCALPSIYLTDGHHAKNASSGPASAPDAPIARNIFGSPAGRRWQAACGFAAPESESLPVPSASPSPSSSPSPSASSAAASAQPPPVSAMDVKHSSSNDNNNTGSNTPDGNGAAADRTRPRRRPAGQLSNNAIAGIFDWIYTRCIEPEWEAERKRVMAEPNQIVRVDATYHVVKNIGAHMPRPPVVFQVTPSHGPCAGNTLVTVRGWRLSADGKNCTFLLGGGACTDVQRVLSAEGAAAGAHVLDTFTMRTPALRNGKDPGHYDLVPVSPFAAIGAGSSIAVFVYRDGEAAPPVADGASAPAPDHGVHSEPRLDELPDQVVANERFLSGLRALREYLAKRDGTRRFALQMKKGKQWVPLSAVFIALMNEKGLVIDGDIKPSDKYVHTESMLLPLMIHQFARYNAALSALRSDRHDNSKPAPVREHATDTLARYDAALRRLDAVPQATGTARDVCDPACARRKAEAEFEETTALLKLPPLLRGVYVDNVANRTNKIQATWDRAKSQALSDGDCCARMVVLQDLFHAKQRPAKYLQKQHRDCVARRHQLTQIFARFHRKRCEAAGVPVHDVHTFREQIQKWCDDCRTTQMPGTYVSHAELLAAAQQRVDEGVRHDAPAGYEFKEPSAHRRNGVGDEEDDEAVSTEREPNSSDEESAFDTLPRRQPSRVVGPAPAPPAAAASAAAPELVTAPAAVRDESPDDSADEDAADEASPRPGAAARGSNEQQTTAGGKRKRPSPSGRGARGAGSRSPSGRRSSSRAPSGMRREARKGRRVDHSNHAKPRTILHSEADRRKAVKRARRQDAEAKLAAEREAKQQEQADKKRAEELAAATAADAARQRKHDTFYVLKEEGARAVKNLKSEVVTFSLVEQIKSRYDAGPKGTNENEGLHRVLKDRMCKPGGVRGVQRTRRILQLIMLDWNRKKRGDEPFDLQFVDPKDRSCYVAYNIAAQPFDELVRASRTTTAPDGDDDKDDDGGTGAAETGAARHPLRFRRRKARIREWSAAEEKHLETQLKKYKQVHGLDRPVDKIGKFTDEFNRLASGGGPTRTAAEVKRKLEQLVKTPAYRLVPSGAVAAPAPAAEAAPAAAAAAAASAALLPLERVPVAPGVLVARHVLHNAAALAAAAALPSR